MTLLDPALSPARVAARSLLQAGETLRWIGVAPDRVSAARNIMAVVGALVALAVVGWIILPALAFFYDAALGANRTRTPPWAVAMLGAILALGLFALGDLLWNVVRKVRGAAVGARRAVMITNRRFVAFEFDNDPLSPRGWREELPLAALRGADVVRSSMGGAFLRVRGPWPNMDAIDVVQNWYAVTGGAEEASALIEAEVRNRKRAPRAEPVSVG